MGGGLRSRPRGRAPRWMKKEQPQKMGTGQGSKGWGTSEVRGKRWGHEDGLGNWAGSVQRIPGYRINGERPQGRTGREQGWAWVQSQLPFKDGETECV